MSRLDRYLIRETLAPFFLALAIFTFILQVQPLLDRAESLLAKGIPLGTVGYLLLTLIPQALGLTIPIAFLTGLLIALGRLSADRESVALQACGVSPWRLMRPVLLMAVVAAGADFYVMSKLIPDANQSFREVTFSFMARQSESEIRPQLFYEGFPGKVIFVRGVNPGGGWAGVSLADTSDLSRAPAMTYAETGHLVIDRDRRAVDLFLVNAYQYAAGKDPGTYDTTRPLDGAPMRVSIPAESVFGTGDSVALTRGNTERTIPELRAEIVAKAGRGEPPHNEVIVLNQIFSFPVACMVLAPLGLVLGLHTRAEGKLVGLTQGLVVIFLYYGVMIQAEGMTKGFYSNEHGVGIARWLEGSTWPAYMTRWWPNLVMGIIGGFALWRRSRPITVGPQVDVHVWLKSVAGRVGRRRTSTDGAVGAGQPGGAPARKVAVVLRVPHFALPRPRLLDVYISGRYLRLVALAFVGLLGLVYIGAFMDRIDKLFKGQASASVMAEFLAYSTPQFVAFIVPLATLVAVLGTIGGLTKTGELTIMRACGVSLYRAAMPLLFLATVWTALLFVLNDRVVARATQRAEAIDDVIRDRAPHAQNVVRNRHWLAAADGTIYHYQFYEPGARRLHGLSVFEPSASGPFRLESHLHARVGEFRDDHWVLREGWLQRFRDDGRSDRRPFREEVVDLEEPGRFAEAEIDAQVMTYAQLREYIAQRSASGFSLADQHMDLQRKLAFPLVPIVMTLLAIPFGVTTGRRGALYGIGLAIVLAFSYFLLSAFFAAAGRATVLPAWLAAWAPNILFCAAALYLTLRVRT